MPRPEHYLAVWQDDGPVLQSAVSTDKDPTTLSNNDWVTLAALSEGYTPTDVEILLDQGYSLYLVVPLPTHFYV